MADRVGQQLGNYRLTRLLGRGGFAEVYLGEHLRLKTQAAIKVLHTQLADSDVEGFLKEAQFIASLEHPHIVRILDFDVEESIPFLVMSYAPNGTLRQLHPKDSILPLTTVVGYVKQVADALQYAHDEKLIHRDIKPENMLLGRRNEILLSDFGIALVAQSSRYQSTQEMVGTMAYMPPEQIQGKPRPASDQYALGIVAYEWLTGDRPFHGSAIEIVAQHLAVPPAPLQEKVSTISPDIEQVVLTALAKDPKERFGSVQAFANALEQASHMDAPRFVNPVVPEVQPPRVETPKPVVKPAVAPPPPRTELVAPSQPAGTTLYIYRGHSESVNAIVCSPDGKYIASGGNDKIVQVWNVGTGRNLCTYREHSRAVNAIAWSSDGKRIASASDDKTVQVWESATGYQGIAYRGHSDSVKRVVWSPDINYIASISYDRTMQVWNAKTGNRISIDQCHASNIRGVAWSPDGKYIAFTSDAQTMQVKSMATGQKILSYKGHSGMWNWVHTIEWSPNGVHISSGDGNGKIHIWEAATGKRVVTYNGHSARIYAVAWSPDNIYIASASGDGTVQVWEAVNGHKVFTYGAHSASVHSLAWSPDGKRIASAGDDKTVQVWVTP